MRDFTITEARIGTDGGGMACGPVGGAVVGEAKFTADDGTSFYVSLAEVDGIPNVFKTPESTYEKQVNMVDDDAFWKQMNDEYFIRTGEYADMFGNVEDELYGVYRYLIYLVRCSWEDAEKFIDATDGKYLSEIDIPKTDLEEEWEEMEEDDE